LETKQTSEQWPHAEQTENVTVWHAQCRPGDSATYVVLCT